MHIKTKQTTCRIQIQVQKVWFWKKNSIFWLFPIFFPWSHRVKFLFFNFSRFQKKIFFEMASMGPLECWKKQSHEKWAHLGHPLRSHARSSICACGFHPPPCGIGLNELVEYLFVANIQSVAKLEFFFFLIFQNFKKKN